MTRLRAALSEIVPIVSDDPLDLVAASRDLWPRDTLELTRGRLPPLPLAVCWPERHEQVCALLEWATRNGTPIVPYGGGSGVCGGAAGRSGSIVVDTKRMNRIGTPDREQWTCTLGPGGIGQEVEDAIQAAGFTLGHSPSSIWCSTPGGWAAARSAGQFSSLYGKFEDMVLSMRVATPQGTLRTGLDCPRGEEDLGPVIQGSEGTLGVVTELTVRVAPRPVTRWLRGYAFPTLSAALEAMRAVMQAELWPAVLRLYDPVDTIIGGRLGRGHRREVTQSATERRQGALRRLLAAIDASDSVRRREFAVPLSVPQLLNRVAGGLDPRVLLIVGWEGDPAVVRAMVKAARPLLAEGEDLGAEVGEDWYRHRHDVSYRLSPIFSRGAFADTMEVASTWSHLPAMYDGVREALGARTLVMAHFSHAYPEGCSIYFSFAGRGSVERYDRTWADALQAVRQAGGTVTHHHGVGLLKAAAATREAGHALRVYQRRKALLDPAGILNPGRLYLPATPLDAGPRPPTQPGPVFSVDERSLVAAVDPLSAPPEVETALARRGFRLRIRPDRPLAEWLRAWRVEAFDRHELPMLGLQGRFGDGCGAWVGYAPRSAAGPDLRWGLLRDATPEVVEVPVARTTHQEVVVAVSGDEGWPAVQAVLRRGLRPSETWATPDGRLRVAVAGPAAGELAELVPGPAVPPSGARPPRPSDARIRAEEAGSNPASGTTCHHLLAREG